LQSLNLYAKIEPLIGFYEAYEELYDEYEKLIDNIAPKTLLDVGCGNGNFLKRFNHLDAKGIDISSSMVELCRKKGLDVSCKKVEDITEKFDVITAVADVLNYLDKNELKSFLKAVENSLNSGGYFIFDINTYFGFSEVADGVMVSEDDSGFLAVEAEFLDDELVTDFTYFEKEDKCHKKYQWRIRQYFHNTKDIEKLFGLKLVEKKKINLFSEDEEDKIVLMFKK